MLFSRKRPEGPGKEVFRRNLAGWAALAVLGCGADRAEPAPRFREDWALLYWLPYDNDLSGAAADVLDALASEHGPGPGRIAVRAQVDLPGAGGMVRMSIAPDGRRTIARLDGREGSSSAAELGAFLDDAATTLEARRTMIAILGHSGPVGQLAADDTPAPRSWMAIDDVAAAIESYGVRETGTIELVFLQTCTAASLETIWELRRAGRFLLASQAPLGAPNHYYGGVLGALAAVPGMDGAELAEVLVASERPDMFVGLTLFDLAASEALPEVLREAAETSTGPLPAELLAEATTVQGGERLVDAVALARALERRQPEQAAPFRALHDLVARELVVWRRDSPAPDPALGAGLPDPSTLGGAWVRLRHQGAAPPLPVGLDLDTRIGEVAGTRSEDPSLQPLGP